MEYIQVRVSEEGTLRNQRYAFTDRFTLVTELLQNARRAGATLIEVSHDPLSRTLRVLDDGHGIENFGKLLTFNESGWDDALCAEEHPFGAGFSRCLYASTRCIIASGGKRIDFDTAQALSKAVLAVEDVGDAPAKGTLVELHGVDLPDLESRIEDLCKGFAVPVRFNGKLVPRPHAPSELRPISTPIGGIHLAGVHSGRHSTAIVAYLQGFKVMLLPNYMSWDPVPNVVHLDSKVFLARLPDRDKLIDADVQELKIREHVRMAWREVLLERKAQLASVDFVEDFFEVMRYHRHLDLLNDVGWLPRQLCDRAPEYPVKSRDPHGAYLRKLTRPLRRQQVEDGEVRLIALEWADGDNSAKWMLARALGHVIVDITQLDAGHWVHPYVTDMNGRAVDVQVTNEILRSSIDTDWISAEVVLCDEITVRMDDEAVTLVEEGLYHNGVFYVPGGEGSGRAMRQCSSYIDGNDRFHESDMQADVAALSHLVGRLRMTDPVEAMRSLLKDLHSARYPSLHGLSFRIGIAQDPDSHTVELIA